MSASTAIRRDRAAGTLYGLAIGDALGMPTQMLARPEIRRRYGDLVAGFHPGPADHPIAAGLAAGTVTDDTEQAVLLGRLLVDGRGHIDPHVLADALQAWERDVRARGSLELLGPSTRSALEAIRAGVPVAEAGRTGATNGAAMRIAPVGVATSPSSTPPVWGPLVERVVEVSSVTHGTGLALAGAAAVAAAVSAGVEGAAIRDSFAAAVAAAHDAAGQGRWVAGADVAARIDWAVGLVAGRRLDAAMELVVRLVGTSLATQESVPAAFAVLAAVPDDPWTAVRVAASLGGDTDTIAAMVGAVAGACHGVDAWPVTARRTIEAQGLGLTGLAGALLGLRSEGRSG